MENQKRETLQDRMKIYEHNNKGDTLLPYKPFIARLDGVNFSKYTQGFNKPYDMLFRTVMILTMNDLVDKFKSSTGYTQSDEITLVFPMVCTKEEYDKKINKTYHYRKGRKIKICSIFASFCTSRFIFHMTRLINLDSFGKTKELKERINKMMVGFDCRIIEYPDEKDFEILNHQIWRTLDCNRNAILQYGETHIGKKNIINMNCKQISSKLLEMGIDFQDPQFILNGVYCKKILYSCDDNNTIRSKYINKTFKIKYSDEILKMLFSKYLFTKEESEDNKDDNELMLNKYDLESRSIVYNDEKNVYEELS